MSLTAKIVTNKGFKLVGFKREMTNERNQGAIQGPAFWQEIVRSGKIAELMPLMDQEPRGIIGMCVYNTQTDDRKFDYYIGCATTQSTPEALDDYSVPAGTWAVFQCESVAEMNRIMPLIVTEWQVNSDYHLVNQGYETGEMLAPSPDIEIYPDQTGSVDVWTAVKPKGE